MSLFDTYLKTKMSGQQAEPAARKTPAPLGLHQASSIEFSSVDLVLAEAGGALFAKNMPKGFGTTQIVTEVGRFELFGHTVYRSYLNDRVSFVEIAVKHGDTDPAHIRLYTLQEELPISSEAQRRFFLGKAPEYSEKIEWENGERVKTRTLVAPREPALFGMSQFMRDDISFNRVWGDSTEEEVPLVEANETKEDTMAATTILHRMMQFARLLDGDIPEYIYADYQTDADGDIVRAYVGLDITPNSMTILAA